jgi:hypothetical protein
VRIYADQTVENLAAPHVKHRVLDPDPSSRSTCRRITKWLEECTSSHSKCSFSKPSKLPTRVLDVSPPDVLGGLRLHITGDGESGTYVALSYCWGSSQKVMTTVRNLEKHKKRIKESSLPKTIRDAVRVTRSLGVRFLWVDALCIVQDSINGEDWHRECSTMSDVYSNAFLTISAEVAKDSAEGFLDQRTHWAANPSLQKPYHQETGQECGSVYFVDHALYSYYEESWPSARAWAFQERRLSRRVLDYREYQISLSCKTGIYEETESKLSETYYQAGSRPMLFSSLHAEDVLQEWYKSVEDYSQRDLTFEADKLPALSGYAHMIQKHVGGAYLAGIWKCDLLIGLLWHLSTTRFRLRKPSQQRAPSWSWAALDGSITYNRFWVEYGKQRKPSDLWLKAIEVQVKPRGSDSMGQVLAGTLKASSHLKRATWLEPEKGAVSCRRNDFLSYSDVENWNILRTDDRDEMDASNEKGHNLIPVDGKGRPIALCLFDTEYVCPKNIWCLAVVATRGLVLEYLAEQNVYQRVGFYMTSDSTWMSKSPISTITIV